LGGASDETKKEDMFMMILVPSLKFLQTYGDSAIFNVTYLDRNNSKFSGIILFHNLDGKFVNGYRYVEGAIVAAMNPIEKKSDDRVFLREGELVYVRDGQFIEKHSLGNYRDNIRSFSEGFYDMSKIPNNIKNVLLPDMLSIIPEDALNKYPHGAIYCDFNKDAIADTIVHARFRWAIIDGEHQAPYPLSLKLLYDIENYVNLHSDLFRTVGSQVPVKEVAVRLIVSMHAG
jgi:hypothetical protein